MNTPRPSFWRRNLDLIFSGVALFSAWEAIKLLLVNFGSSWPKAPDATDLSFFAVASILAAGYAFVRATQRISADEAERRKRRDALMANVRAPHSR